MDNKLFAGLKNKLEVVDGEDKGKQLTFVDDYPTQSPFVPATQSIQDILDNVLKDNPSIPKVMFLKLFWIIPNIYIGLEQPVYKLKLTKYIQVLKNVLSCVHTLRTCFALFCCV